MKHQLSRVFGHWTVVADAPVTQGILRCKCPSQGPPKPVGKQSIGPLHASTSPLKQVSIPVGRENKS